MSVIKDFAMALWWAGFLFLALTIYAIVIFALDPSGDRFVIILAWFSCACLSGALGFSRMTIETMKRIDEINERTIALQRETLDMQEQTRNLNLLGKI